MKKTENGFTLIELLVVVAIIGILAAIAIPQFSEYRKRGFDSRSVSDLRNASTAEEAYYADNESYKGCTGIGGSASNACETALPGFRGSKDVDLTMTVTGASVGFTGNAFHPKGNRNDATNSYFWNSQAGGLCSGATQC